jgi:hypothetical protein
MPTSFTEIVLQGATAKQFAARCMRNFGATAHMRDEPLDMEVPRQFPDEPESPWLRQRVEEAEASLEAWHVMPLMDKIITAQSEIDDSIARYEKQIATNEMGNLKLKKTYVLISHMVVPDELKHFKEFMLNQLTDSMEDSTHFRSAIKTFQDIKVEDYVRDYTESLEGTVARYKESREKGKECQQERNRILALMWGAIDSIPE